MPSHNVVHHPSAREMPEPLMPLETEEARKEYDALGRLLFDSGRLTMDKHRDLSTYAILFDNIITMTAARKRVATAAITQLQKAKRRLGLDDLNNPIAAPQGVAENKFARNGLSASSRRGVR